MRRRCVGSARPGGKTSLGRETKPSLDRGKPSLGRGKLIQSFFRLLSRELTGEQLLAVRSRLQ
jgi:hypothetical protein